LTDLQHEEDTIREEEDAEVERKRDAAARLARDRGLHSVPAEVGVLETKSRIPDVAEISAAPIDDNQLEEDGITGTSLEVPPQGALGNSAFVPARLPNFG